MIMIINHSVLANEYGLGPVNYLEVRLSCSQFLHLWELWELKSLV